MDCSRLFSTADRISLRWGFSGDLLKVRNPAWPVRLLISWQNQAGYQHVLNMLPFAAERAHNGKLFHESD